MNISAVKKTFAVKFCIFTFSAVLLNSALIFILINNLTVLIQYFTDNEALLRAAGSLREADIVPPFGLLFIGCALFFIFKNKIGKYINKGGIGLKTAFISGCVLYFAVTFLICLLFTRINHIIVLSVVIAVFSYF